MRGKTNKGAQVWYWDQEQNMPIPVTIVCSFDYGDCVVTDPRGNTFQVTKYALASSADYCVAARARSVRTLAQRAQDRMDEAVERGDFAMLFDAEALRSKHLRRLYRIEYQHSEFGRYP